MVYYGYEGGDRSIRGAIINGVQYGDITVSVEKGPADNSIDHGELHNFPNPFNSMTTVTFDLNSSTHVEIVVYDLLGRKVRALLEGVRLAGSHSIRWDGKDGSGKNLSSGVYLIVLRTPDLINVRRIIYLNWDGTDDSGNTLASGIYVYRIEARSKHLQASYSESRKLVFTR